MTWLDRLLGRSRPVTPTEWVEDKAALDDLHNSFMRVRNRTDRLIEEYTRAEQQRVGRGKA